MKTIDRITLIDSGEEMMIEIREDEVEEFEQAGRLTEEISLFVTDSDGELWSIEKDNDTDPKWQGVNDDDIGIECDAEQNEEIASELRRRGEDELAKEIPVNHTPPPGHSVRCIKGNTASECINQIKEHGLTDTTNN